MILMHIGMDSEHTRAFARPSGWDSRTPEVARQIPGARWDHARKQYEGTPDAIAALCEALRLAKVAEPSGFIDTVDELPSLLVDATGLREYQIEGAKFLTKTAPHGGALLADDVGLGKTAQALRAIDALRTKEASNVVVVCPAIAKGVWKDEATKWIPSWNVYVLSGTTASTKTPGGLFEFYARAKNNLFILNYEIAFAWADSMDVLDVLILDEVHDHLLDHRSKRSTAVRRLAERAHAKIAISATPMTARPRDLWNVLDTMCPGRFGKGPFPFYIRYSDAHKETVAKDTTIWITDGSSHEDELAFRLKWMMLRRSKADVMHELPVRTRQVIPVEVPSRAIAPIWDSKKYRKDALSKALALSGTGKVKQATDLAASLHTEGHSVLLFTHLKETSRKLHDELTTDGRTTALLNGDINSTERSKEVERLRRAAQTQPVIAVATIDAVGVAIDLSFCDVAIFVDLSYVPSKLLQAEGRIHRHGQTRPVLIYYLIGIGTADEYVRAKVVERLGLFEKITGSAQEASELGGDLGGMEKMSEEDVLADLRRAVLAGEVLPEEEGVWA